MKTHRTSTGKRGFTLMELMVAMAVTTIIVTVLVSITSIALDTWNRSRSELRASRQAKTMLDVMSRDFESLVARRGNKYEWLSAKATNSGIGDSKLTSTSASELVFFTAVTDLYDGYLGKDSTTDQGGYVSCVGYQLDYKDPVEGDSTSNFKTFVLNRLVVNPDTAFENLLAKEDLEAQFQSYKTDLQKENNFVCENIFQFALTFHVEVSQTNGTVTTLVSVPVTLGPKQASATEFRIKGTGIVTDANASVSPEELAAGRLTAMEISVTVMSDFGIEQMKRRSFKDAEQEADFLAQNSYQYTKLVQLPSM